MCMCLFVYVYATSITHTRTVRTPWPGSHSMCIHVSNCNAMYVYLNVCLLYTCMHVHKHTNTHMYTASTHTRTARTPWPGSHWMCARRHLVASRALCPKPLRAACGQFFGIICDSFAFRWISAVQLHEICIHLVPCLTDYFIRNIHIKRKMLAKFLF